MPTDHKTTLRIPADELAQLDEIIQRLEPALMPAHGKGRGLRTAAIRWLIRHYHARAWLDGNLVVLDD